MRKLHTIEMHRLSITEFKNAEKIPLVVVLDNIRSLYNVGSVFRCGDAFRIEKICLCGITACPPSAEIHKTALGGEDSVAWEYYKNTATAVDSLHNADYYIYSIEQVEGSEKLQDLKLPYTFKDGKSIKGFAVILGNEVKGVDQTIVDKSDNCLEIPQFGTKHSLNVSTTAGIVMWEFVRRLAFEQHK